jgi:ABC-2 type transport system permease protein
VIIMRRAVEDRRRALAWWTVGIAALVLFTVALFPSVEGNADFQELAEDLPEAVRSLFAFDEAVPITTAAGYLQARLFGSLLPLLLLVFAIRAGARAIAGDEEDGTLELVLMHPVTRQRVLVERYVAVVVMIGLLTAALTGATLLFAPLFGALDGVSVTGLVAASLAAGLLACAHGTLAFAIGAVTGRHARATAVATVVAVVGYLVQGLAPLSSILDPVQPLSPWHWYSGRNMLSDGVAPLALLLPALFCAALFCAGWSTFGRRDLR